MSKKRKYESDFDEKNKVFVEDLKNILPSIIKGLEFNDLYKEGLLKLSIGDLKNILNSKLHLVYLPIVIQAYPGKTVQADENEMYKWVQAFESLVITACLEKRGFFTATITSKKLNFEGDIKFDFSNFKLDPFEFMKQCNDMTKQERTMLEYLSKNMFKLNTTK